MKMLKVAGYVLLIASTLLLGGCDRLFHGYYDLTIENHLNQEIMVIADTARIMRVRPCSVQVHPSVPGMRVVGITVTDASGIPIFRFEKRPEKTPEGFYHLLVRIPPEGASECPAPLTGQFMVLVKNYTWDEAVVFLKGKEVGRIPALSTTERLGPFPGTWATFRIGLEVRGPGGQRLPGVKKADYDLGQIPEFVIGFTASRPIPTGTPAPSP